MNLLVIPSLVFVMSGAMGYQDKGIFTFEQSDAGTEIGIYANEKSEIPVSRYLYGKFTEHLGRNIYGGMWAQILHKPGFEGAHFWGTDSAGIRQRMIHYERWLNILSVMESYDPGIAPWWLTGDNGPENGRCSVETIARCKAICNPNGGR